LTYSEVSDVTGYIGNYNVTMHRKPRYVTEGVCTGCGECDQGLPDSRPSDWDVGLQKPSCHLSFLSPGRPDLLCH
jgi:heterodisulfide reductase subunit A2